MPQLPSGRQVAINPIDLDDLVKNAENPANVHHLMAIKSEADLFPYIAVLYLLPEAEAHGRALDLEFRSDALPRPPGLVIVPSGFHLSDWDALTAEWTDEDIVAFRQFLETRAQPTITGWLECIRNAQRALSQSASPTIRILVAWWQAGIHPAQEEGWAASDVGSPDWDDCDLLAAIGQLVQAIENDSSAHDWRIGARLNAFWHIVRQQIPEVAGWSLAGRSVRTCAEEARSGGWLVHASERDRGWVHEQGIIECVCAWNSLGEHLREIAPQANGIIELVALSPEASRQADSRAS